MLIGRVRYDSRTFPVFYDKEENMVFEIYADIKSILGSFGKDIPISSQGIDLESVEILVPVKPTKIVAVGKNYLGHIKEMDSEIPTEPVIFLKPSSCIIAHGSNVIYPNVSNRIEYEGELALVIKKKMRNVQAKDIEINPEEYFGYTSFLDMTARDFQRTDIVWTRAKGFDTFGPFGPWINIDPLPASLTIKTFLNGVIKQDSNINKMVFSSFEILEFISFIMTLEVGDIVPTGTPDGVGQVKISDIINLQIENLSPLEVTITEK
ncbi:MAG: fumarylacetoacetate hydrolase family protein [Candidatus Heimdallarchaeota archaeon]|nr:fumarylacetoacetate hydrolase family protein [Candidatus Heimdallarchaeota archaeon]